MGEKSFLGLFEGRERLLDLIGFNDETYVLLIVSSVLSTLTFYHDVASDPVPRPMVSYVVMWVYYIVSGAAAIMLIFYGLQRWVPPKYQLHDQVWLTISVLASGYAHNIIDFLAMLSKKLAYALPRIFEAILKCKTR